MKPKKRYIEIKMSDISRREFKPLIKKLDDWAIRDATIRADSIIYIPIKKQKKLLA